MKGRRLDRWVRARARMQQVRRAELAQARQVLGERIAAEEQLQTLMRGQRATLTGTAEQASADLQGAADLLQLTAQGLEVAQEQRQSGASAVEQAQQVVRTATAELKAVERLQARYRQQWEEELRRREQRVLDDLTASRDRGSRGDAD